MTNTPAVLWDDMTKQARIAACKAMSHRTYKEMQKVTGASASRIRRFFIENSIEKHGASMTIAPTYIGNIPYRPLTIVDDDALERAFLRETHPDGTPYTKDDIFAAMAGFADRPAGGFRHITTPRRKRRFVDPTLSLPNPARFADGG